RRSLWAGGPYERERHRGVAENAQRSAGVVQSIFGATLPRQERSSDVDSPRHCRHDRTRGPIGATSRGFEEAWRRTSTCHCRRCSAHFPPATQREGPAAGRSGILCETPQALGHFGGKMVGSTPGITNQGREPSFV